MSSCFVLVVLWCQLGLAVCIWRLTLLESYIHGIPNLFFLLRIQDCCNAFSRKLYESAIIIIIVFIVQWLTIFVSGDVNVIYSCLATVRLFFIACCLYLFDVKPMPGITVFLRISECALMDTIHKLIEKSISLWYNHIAWWFNLIIKKLPLH